MQTFNMVLNVPIISILITVLIVPSSPHVCNFIGYTCSLYSAKSSYFTQLDYHQDPEIGDSWLLKNNQAPLVSGRLVSALFIPPDGPSPHCLMIRYSITGDSLIRLIVITQSDDYEVRFCYQSNDADGDVKKISVPFSMYSHTRITLDISMSSYENCVFNLESFWVVRDDCYHGFKERMTQCPEYIAPKNDEILTTAATDPSEFIIETTSLQYNDTTDQWNDNVTNHVNNSPNVDPTIRSSQSNIYSPTTSLTSNCENVSLKSSEFSIKTNNETINLLKPVHLNETIVQEINEESQVKKIEASKANIDRVNVTLNVFTVNSSTVNYSEDVTKIYTEKTASNFTLLDSFLPIITTESWRSKMMVINSSNGKMDSSDGITGVMNSRLVQSTSPTIEQQMDSFLRSNSSAVTDNTTAASTTFTEYSNKTLLWIEGARNKSQVKPNFNQTAGVQSVTESISYVGTKSPIVNYSNPLFTTEIHKLDLNNKSSFKQNTGKVKGSTQIGNFVRESMNFNSTGVNRLNDDKSTTMMQLDVNVSSIKYPSNDLNTIDYSEAGLIALNDRNAKQFDSKNIMMLND